MNRNEVPGQPEEVINWKKKLPHGTLNNIPFIHASKHEENCHESSAGSNIAHAYFLVTFREKISDIILTNYSNKLI